MKAKTRKELERENMELRAQLAHRYASACSEISKASTDHLTASAVILTLTALGGREIVTPIAIRDGLSKDTIAAIKADLIRSHEQAVAVKPKA